MLFKRKKEEKSQVPIVDAERFEEFISVNMAVIDCYNDHCVPCRRIHPMIEELSRKYEGKVRFGKLNTDYSVEIAVKYGVMSVPTILFFKNGELKGSMKEVKSIKHLEEEMLKAMEAKK